MPHDMFGEKVEVGQEVLVHCFVKDVFETEDSCNVTLEVMGDEDYLPTFTCNSRLTEVVSDFDCEGDCDCDFPDEVKDET